MLESFILKEKDAVRVGHDDLRKTTTSIFEKLGVPSDDAAVAADVLVMRPPHAPAAKAGDACLVVDLA